MQSIMYAIVVRCTALLPQSTTTTTKCIRTTKMSVIAYESLDDIINDCLAFWALHRIANSFSVFTAPKIPRLDGSMVRCGVNALLLLLCAYAFCSLITLQHRLFTLNRRWFSAFHSSKMSHSKLNMICYFSSVINLCDWIIKWVLFSKQNIIDHEQSEGKQSQIITFNKHIKHQLIMIDICLSLGFFPRLLMSNVRINWN